MPMWRPQAVAVSGSFGVSACSHWERPAEAVAHNGPLVESPPHAS